MSGQHLILNLLGGVALLIWSTRLVRTGVERALQERLRKLIAGSSRKSHVWFRWFNEAPVLMLLVAVVLVVVKPF